MNDVGANAPNHTINHRDQLDVQIQILERSPPHWDSESARVDEQVLNMRNHSGIIGTQSFWMLSVHPPPLIPPFPFPTNTFVN